MRYVELTPLVLQIAAGRSLWVGLETSPIPGVTEPHVTLLFLGKYVGVEVAEALHVALPGPDWRKHAIRPHGVARFRGSPREGDPVVLLVDSPELRGMRQYVMDLASGFDTPGLRRRVTPCWTPHVTLFRHPTESALSLAPPRMLPEITVHRAVMVCGDVRLPYPLGSSDEALTDPL